MSVRLLYVADSLGATVRGMTVLRALGAGLLRTPYPQVARLEGVATFGGLLSRADCYVWDRQGRIPYRPGLQVSVGQERDGFDLCLDMPIVPRLLADLDADAAERWWQEPLVVHRGGGRACSVDTGEGLRRLWLGLAQRGPEPGRVLTVGPSFYWPAMELMTVADEVHGGDQSMTEWAVVRGKLPDDGALEAADAIRRLLGD